MALLELSSIAEATPTAVLLQADLTESVQFPGWGKQGRFNMCVVLHIRSSCSKKSETSLHFTHHGSTPLTSVITLKLFFKEELSHKSPLSPSQNKLLCLRSNFDGSLLSEFDLSRSSSAIMHRLTMLLIPAVQVFPTALEMTLDKRAGVSYEDNLFDLTGDILSVREPVGIYLDLAYSAAVVIQSTLAKMSAVAPRSGDKCAGCPKAPYSTSLADRGWSHSMRKASTSVLLLVTGNSALPHQKD
ncbi:hypothetical protein K461DRAFT_308447 [Myriangium duriaei CBS 260.36]|uniref:Uncharacterized protein n=1 Tax=Myriangium duriaei CBS 260.36 TaxID=1168546 RepID=A0A9P4J172_9PEZI|nr:hypothetical protein K461DRAFT_308447 [Myriangium duriaei CBS 260.36]